MSVLVRNGNSYRSHCLQRTQHIPLIMWLSGVHNGSLNISPHVSYSAEFYGS